ncbi:MAG: hypothetical protein ACSLE0_01885, partial [Chitinophagaceae bacterium]
MKENKIIFFILFLLSLQNISAQTRSFLTGKITDEKTGESLPNATIRIHELNRDAIARDNGEYKTSF